MHDGVSHQVPDCLRDDVDRGTIDRRVEPLAGEGDVFLLPDGFVVHDAVRLAEHRAQRNHPHRHDPVAQRPHHLGGRFERLLNPVIAALVRRTMREELAKAGVARDELRDRFDQRVEHRKADAHAFRSRRRRVRRDRRRVAIDARQQVPQHVEAVQ